MSFIFSEKIWKYGFFVFHKKENTAGYYGFSLEYKGFSLCENSFYPIAFYVLKIFCLPIPFLDDILEHEQNMAEASTHDKEMEYLMEAEVFKV